VRSDSGTSARAVRQTRRKRPRRGSATGISRARIRAIDVFEPVVSVDTKKTDLIGNGWRG